MVSVINERRLNASNSRLQGGSRYFFYAFPSAMLIDTSLRYIKMHFLVVSTDRSRAPVNLALERAAFSNYRSNY